MTDASAWFEAYGLRAAIDGDWTEVLEAVRQDFAWFEVDGPLSPLDLRIEIRRGKADLGPYGQARASAIRATSITYGMPGYTISEYQGGATAIMDHGHGTLSIMGTDPDPAYEAAHLALKGAALSCSESRGLVALHALGLVGSQGALALLLPSGGGKSTMAAHARLSGARLLSDDAPLLDPHGSLHPFPLRLGVVAPPDGSSDAEATAEVRRLGGRVKTMLDPGRDGWVAMQPAPLVHIVLGRRSLGQGSALRRVERSAALRPILQEAVLRVAVGHGVGFMMAKRKLGPTLRKIGKLTRRLRTCTSALRKAQVWELTMGRDLDRCWEALAPLLR